MIIVSEDNLPLEKNWYTYLHCPKRYSLESIYPKNNWLGMNSVVIYVDILTGEYQYQEMTQLLGNTITMITAELVFIQRK